MPSCSPRQRRGATVALRFGLVVVVVAAGLLLSARPAFAHADIISASPAAGDGLPQAPGAVVIKFTEPLNRKLSRIDVLDRSDRDVGQGSTEPVVGDREAMQRKLGLLQPGTYTVRWVTVSTVDGHTLKGRYSFGIGDANVDPTSTVAASPISSEGWGGLAGRALAFAGLAIWTGSILLRRTGRRAGVSGSRLHGLDWAGPALTLWGTGLSVASSAIVASGSLGEVNDVLLAGASGHWRLTVLVASAAGLILVGTLHARRWPASRLLLGVAAAVAVVGEAASGHSAATSAPVVATVSLAVHVIAVGVWVFAIIAALLSAERIAVALAAFSPAAIVAAVLVVATGILNSVLELDSVGDLTSTGYGKAILAKAAALVVMAVFGAGHALRRRSRVTASHRLRELATGEIGAAAVALVVAAVLVGFPNPPRQEAAAEALAKPDTVSDLTHQAAVSVADGSGPFVVGLTVLPPRPGPVEVRVQVIGVEAGDGLRDARVVATAVGEPPITIGLRSCGLGCFKGDGHLAPAGTWQFEASITSNRGPISTRDTIPLPTPDGSTALRRTIDDMNRLQSLRVLETLRSKTTQAPLVAEYDYRAPNEFSYSIVDGAAQVTIGRQQYSREKPNQPWTVEPPPPVATSEFRWPGNFYRSYWSPSVATRILGTETIDGVPTQIVAFLRPDVSAWFKLWIGTDDGLVRRMQMRAQGHLMDHDYVDINGPIEIVPPAGAVPSE